MLTHSTNASDLQRYYAVSWSHLLPAKLLGRWSSKSLSVAAWFPRRGIEGKRGWKTMGRTQWFGSTGHLPMRIPPPHFACGCELWETACWKTA